MGLQCIFAAYGGTVDRVGEIVHGKTSVLSHDGKGIFKGIRDEIKGTRYHSLAGDIITLPEELEVTCRTPRLGAIAKPEEGIVMGIRHKTLTLEAVQYHPESILSEEGQTMLANFLMLKGGKWEQNVGFGLSSSEKASQTQRDHISHSKESKTNGAPSILTRIYDQRQKDVEIAKVTPGSLPSDLLGHIDMHLALPQISFYDRLLPASSSSSSAKVSTVALMAEMKRASPSKGNILSPTSTLTSASVGLSYAHAGASVISVLTEPTWFKGTLNDMLAIRQAVSTLPERPAILRKDFIFDTYQIDEARLYGADTILLIVAMLNEVDLKRLYDYSRYARGMEPLVEVNNQEELKRALRIGAKIIGVNNRNLHDFQVDMSTTSRIAEVIDEYSTKHNSGISKDNRKVILCALSGITKREDVVHYVEQGVGAVLVGEALMRAEDKDAFVRTLLGLESIPSGPHSSSISESPSQPSLTGPPDGFAIPDSVVANQLSGEATAKSQVSSSYKPLVKICGIKTPEAALAAADAGADFIGLIFVPKSKRFVELHQAMKIVKAVRSRKMDYAASFEENERIIQSTDFFNLQAARLAKTRRKPLIVGVFQNQPLSTIMHNIDTLNLDVIQLHGNEPAEWCRLLNIPTFKAFHVDERLAEDGVHDEMAESSATLLALKEASRPGYHSIPLLDTKLSNRPGDLSGGAGKVFDWQVAKKLVQAQGLPILLAGGLEIGNVADAVRMVRPWALDVSGGVESVGEKDLGKIRDFIATAKGAV